MHKILLPLISAFAIVGCSQAAQDGPADPSSSPTTAITAETGDPLALYSVFAQQADASDNIVYSPISAAQAFGLVHLGAQGETARQIERTFGLSKGEAGDRELQDLRAKLTRDTQSINVNIANALFLANDYRFRDTYLAQAKSLYGATTATVDFQNDPNGAAALINKWADDATEGLIPQVVTAESIVRDAAAYLANATYFEAAWTQSFRQTERMPFLFGDGQERPFDLMKSEGEYAFARKGSWQAIRIPYGKEPGNFAMDVMLPVKRSADVPEITSANIIALAARLSRAEPESIRLRLPRFEADMKQDLIAPYRALGMTLPFDRNRANLSGMAAEGSLPLYIKQAFQVARLQVYETGTKAAAVTIAVPVPVSMPPPFKGKEFTVDHPFLFAIRDLKSGEILFFGRISLPEPYTG